MAAANIPEVEKSNTINNNPTRNEDDELDSLLNDALDDFNKTIFEEPNALNDGCAIGKDLDPLLLENIWNEPSMKEAMLYFKDSIRSVFSSPISKEKESSNDGNTKVDKCIRKLNKENVGLDIGEAVDIDSLINDFQKMAKMTAETLKNEFGVEESCIGVEDESFEAEFNKKVMEVAQSLPAIGVKNEATTKGYEEEDNGFHTMVRQTIKSLTENNKDLTGSTDLNDISEELNSLLKSIDYDDNLNKNLKKFMAICMKTIRTVVYPSLKVVCDKFPKYLEDCKSKLSEEEYGNYEKQYRLMSDICVLFESEGMDSISDAEEFSNTDVKNEETERLYKNFFAILNVMRETQDFVQLPQELADDVLSGIFNANKENFGLCSIL